MSKSAQLHLLTSKWVHLTYVNLRHFPTDNNISSYWKSNSSLLSHTVLKLLKHFREG